MDETRNNIKFWLEILEGGISIDLKIVLKLISENRVWRHDLVQDCVQWQPLVLAHWILGFYWHIWVTCLA